MLDDDETWVGVSADPLPVSAVLDWLTVPSCGALGIFCGTMRDHSEGRRGITRLDYEAHPTETEPRLARVAAAARGRWPAIARIAILHRIGSLSVGDVAVVVAVSTPHRSESFQAAHWGIDMVKRTAPIWKYEVWDGGQGWGTCAHDLVELDALDDLDDVVVGSH